MFEINVQLIKRSCVKALLEDFGKLLFYNQFCDALYGIGCEDEPPSGQRHSDLIRGL